MSPSESYDLVLIYVAVYLTWALSNRLEAFWGQHCVYIASFPGGTVVRNPPTNAGDTQVQPLGQEDPLEEEMATDSSVLA